MLGQHRLSRLMRTQLLFQRALSRLSAALEEKETKEKAAKAALPKKPRSAYILYSSSERPGVAEQNKEASASDMLKILAEMCGTHLPAPCRRARAHARIETTHAPTALTRPRALRECSTPTRPSTAAPQVERALRRGEAEVAG